MRVLWVTSHVPDPTRGGGWAFEFELIRLLTQRNEVVLVSVVDERASVPAEVRDLVTRVSPVRWEMPAPPRTRLGLLWRVLRRPAGGALAHVSSCADALAAAAAHEEANGDFDVVVIYPGEMAEVIAKIKSPTVLFLTDIHTRQRENELSLAKTARQRLLWRAELAKMRRWERQWYPRATVRTTVTSIDADALRALTGCEAHVVPVMIGDEWFASPKVGRSADLVSFIGALDYRPNIDGVVWFCTDVWPKVKQDHPSARLQVVGRAPVGEVRAAVAGAGGELHPDVPDVFPYYGESAVVVAPIRLGSGMRTKVLHTLATGTPLVATSTAVEGIDIEAGRDFSVANEARAFADRIVDALVDPAAARARGASARKAVEPYSSEAVRARVEELVALAAKSPL